jgi:hypothetical protein
MHPMVVSRALIATFMAAGAIVAMPYRSTPALCARWDSPTPGVAGEPSGIAFETFAPISTGGDKYRLEPHPFTEYPFRVVAVSPQGEEIKGKVAPVAAKDIRWTGTVVPTSPGEWSLRITNLHGSDAKCYEDAALEVAEAPSGSIFVVVVVVGAVVATAAAALALRRRRGREAVGSV